MRRPAGTYPLNWPLSAQSGQPKAKPVTHSGLTEALGNILQLLLHRQVVETLSNRELAVDALLRDIEVLHVEEPIFAHALDECLGELLLALGRAEQAKVEGDEVRPVKIFLLQR